MLSRASHPHPLDDNCKSWKRDIAVARLVDFEAAQAEGISQRQFASDQKIPRTTLQHWAARRGALEAEEELVNFFESPAGLALLHRLLIAAQLVMTLMGNCGIRLVSYFFEYAGLAPFIANSYGAQQGLNKRLHQQVRDFGLAQRQALAKDMPHRKVALCADETFPTASLCLVAIEPVSNFILVEDYADKRDTETWCHMLDDGLDGLNVSIEQMATDEAAALKKLAADRGAARSPDLFHVQNEVNKGCALALARQERAAAEALLAARAERERHREAQEAYDRGPRPRGRRPHFEARIKQAEAVVVAAESHLEAVVGWREVRAESVCGLSRSYHPFDLENGSSRSGALVAKELCRHIAALEKMGVASGLSERGQERLKKAGRRVAEMAAYVSWFHKTVEERLSSGDWSERERSWFHEHLLPGCYLHRVASRAPNSEARKSLEASSLSSLSSLCAPSSGWWELPASRRESLEALALDCADVFQRSSSCVEGRNGQLSLFEHSLRGLSSAKLKALTVIHNYVSRRPDGTTPAQRFFGRAADDLFDWLLEKLPLPARPAKRRPRLHKTTRLEAS